MEVHYLDCSDSFMGAYIISKLTKLHVRYVVYNMSTILQYSIQLLKNTLSVYHASQLHPCFESIVHIIHLPFE